MTTRDDDITLVELLAVIVGLGALATLFICLLIAALGDGFNGSPLLTYLAIRAGVVFYAALVALWLTPKRRTP